MCGVNALGPAERRPPSLGDVGRRARRCGSGASSEETTLLPGADADNNRPREHGKPEFTRHAPVTNASAARFTQLGIQVIER